MKDDTDCNDNNANAYPGATEVKNFIDDDCDCLVDEDSQDHVYYEDADGDGFGNPSKPTRSSDTTPPQGYVTNSRDCNDGNANVNPDADEACNQIDDDCNGVIDDGCTKVIWYRDADGDDYGNPKKAQKGFASVQPSGYVRNNTDCDDTNGSVYPGAPETCNGVDDDCDSSIDEGCKIWYRDLDGDGYGNPKITLNAATQPTGYTAKSGDCNDNDGSVHPYAFETCNGVDDDCDGQVDELLRCITYYYDGDNDTWGDSSKTKRAPTGSPPSGYVSRGGDCNDNNSLINPGAKELPKNGVDENCNGSDIN